MKFPLPRPLFPALAITDADDEAFATLEREFIDKLLLEEHEYRSTGQVDARKWKHLRKSENVVVYRERPGERRSSSASAPPPPPSPTSSVRNEPSNENDACHRLIPPFLIVGKVPGSLDDLLYGFTTPTRESTLIKTSYVDDGVVDIEVLRAIERPSVDAPFRHLSVKWFVLAPLPAVVAPRDYVYIDAIGTRVLPGGERIGYRFSHSINLKGAEPMRGNGFIRANFTICGIFREGPNNHVQLYGRAFFEPGGAIPRSVFTFVVSMQVATAAAQMLNGQLKKLALAVRRLDSRAWTSAVPLPDHTNEANECGVCYKSLNVFTKSRTACVLCTRRLCHACRVRKTLSFVNADYSIKRLRVAICSFCVAQAISVPAHVAAAEEFLSGQEDFYRLPESFCGGNGLATAMASTIPSSFRSYSSGFHGD